MLNKFKVQLLKSIFNHFGRKTQYEKLCEEIEEMFRARNKKQEFEEMVDTWIVLTQFLVQDMPLFEEFLNFKINRTIDRMRTGYYEKEIEK